MDVRAKQRLSYRVAWFLSSGLVAVSPHVNAAVRCSLLLLLLREMSATA